MENDEGLESILGDVCNWSSIDREKFYSELKFLAELREEEVNRQYAFNRFGIIYGLNSEEVIGLVDYMMCRGMTKFLYGSTFDSNNIPSPRQEELYGFNSLSNYRSR